MKNFSLLSVLLTLVMLLFVISGASGRPEREDPQSQNATGVVFHDADGDGTFDPGERPIADVRVSNGREIVTTDSQGRYRLPVDDDTILFVIKPRGWRTPLSKHNLPRFYYIHKPHGSPDLKFAGVAPTGPLPESVDFPLYPQQEPENFKAIMFGDPQPRTQQEVDYITHDVVEELIGTDAAFGVTLGDIAFDDLSLFEPLAHSVALIGIPWYNVIGNHDINYDARHDRHSDETYERVFGPSYYSFDYGPAHFLVLDDIRWLVPENGEKARYVGGLGEEQMAFIRKDLSLIPEDQLTVLMMHIPLMDVEDRHELYRLIEQRPFCFSISAHRHVHEHKFITSEDGWRGPQPHHHVVNVTVSGSWWRGAPDERGIPHATMADGAPNGYSIVTFDGTDYSIEFKAAGRPDDYQMQIHAPEAIAVDQLDQTPILVNVFNGSERSKVEMRIGEGGDWIPMQHAPMVDPAYEQTYEAEQALPEVDWIKLPEPRTSTHIWRGTLPSQLSPGTHLIVVRATGSGGNTYQSRRSIRVTDSQAAAATDSRGRSQAAAARHSRESTAAVPAGAANP